MPWILGGCGCLTLILIIAAIVGFSVYRASKKVTEFTSTIQSHQPSQASTPKAGWNTYTNKLVTRIFSDAMRESGLPSRSTFSISRLMSDVPQPRIIGKKKLARLRTASIQYTI
jgi:hypothetical protein